MNGFGCRLTRAVDKMAAGLVLVNRALGAMALDVEESAPIMLAKNVPDPQLELAGVILMLMAGSLTTLFIGYVVDATRSSRA